jgi:hypothetical protein
MHISVMVVPVVIPPRHHKHKDHDDDEDIVYNMSMRRETMSVTEEVRPMLVQAGDSTHLEQVRITTVVAK